MISPTRFFTNEFLLLKLCRSCYQGEIWENIHRVQVSDLKMRHSQPFDELRSVEAGSGALFFGSFHFLSFHLKLCFH